jgi:hypothetical protein
VNVEVPGGERRNVQTGGGNRVNTISLLGCSTSVALATGPTDEEEETSNHMEKEIYQHSILISLPTLSKNKLLKKTRV